jgi:hypothetical protein
MSHADTIDRRSVVRFVFLQYRAAGGQEQREGCKSMMIELRLQHDPPPRRLLVALGDCSRMCPWSGFP